ncbi:MAG: glycosyltransferase [Pseudomonadota bacterium]
MSAAPPVALTVLLATYNRRDVLEACLRSFCEQRAPAGSYEIVVVDDGSSDDTVAFLEGLDLPVPFRWLTQPNAGAAAARNRGLQVARGRLVLFVNDDTIAAPDLVATHLRLHEELGPGPVAVLGTFAQEPAGLDNALMRYLEGSTEVFLYSRFKPGQVLDGSNLYTCNCSVPLAAVRALGGFDERFARCDGEDTDLGVKLELAGVRLHYRPEARSWHRHVLSLADLERRQLHVSRVFVRFFHMHPHVLIQWGGKVVTLTQADCRATLAQHAALMPTMRAAAVALARVDVGVLERAGAKAAAEQIMARLGHLVANLNGLWWRQGYLEGLREHGIEGFGDILARRVYGGEDLRNPALTVVVPTHDRPAQLVAFLERIARQDLPSERFEVVVADDASTPPAAETLAGRSWPFALRILRQEPAAGPGPARNLAVRAARGRWIVFYNDDGLPAPDNLRLHLEGQLAATGPTAILGRFDLLPKLQDTALRRLLGRGNLMFGQPLMQGGRRYPGLTFCTGNLSLPRELLLAARGFDEAFPFAGAEDSELGYRLGHELGLEVQYDDRIACGHDHAMDLRQVVRRHFVLGWCTLKMADKHGDPTLVAGRDAKALDRRFFKAVQESLAAQRDEVVALWWRLLAAEAAEERGEAGPIPDTEWDPLVHRVVYHAFALGLLVAEAGFAPADYRGGQPLPEPPGGLDA